MKEFIAKHKILSILIAFVMICILLYSGILIKKAIQKRNTAPNDGTGNNNNSNPNINTDQYTTLANQLYSCFSFFNDNEEGIYSLFRQHIKNQQQFDLLKMAYGTRACKSWSHELVQANMEWSLLFALDAKEEKDRLASILQGRGINASFLYKQEY